MRRTKLNKKHLWNFYTFPLLLFITVSCYPTGRPDLDTQPEIRDEKRFPNGTVIGKYTYTDNEGNPVQVKYYADEASYGVELKSIKVVDSSDAPLSSLNYVPNAQNKYEYKSLRSTKPDKKVQMPTDLFNNYPSAVDNKYKSGSDPYDLLNKDVYKGNRYKIPEKPNSDYEIYYQNDLKGPKKCNKEKVHVYFDKENRKIRSAAVNNFEAEKVCEQF